MPSTKATIVLSILLCCGLFCSAQDSESISSSKRIAIKSDLQVGMLAGGQVANEQFIYKSGIMAQYSINTRLSPWIHAGLGMGVQNLETETIIPFFVDIKAQLKQGERAPFLGVNIGSSSGISTYYKNFENYEYHGGFYFSPYYSFQFPIGEKLKFLLATGYIHQVGYIEYFTTYDERYLESFSMDFITVRAGLRF